MARTSRGARVPQVASVTVRFYGESGFTRTEPLVIPIPPEDSAPLTGELVCIKSAQHLSQNLQKFCQGQGQQEIGPAYLPLFGLYVADHDKQQWVDESMLLTEPQELFFRVKLRPASGKLKEGVIMQYLFLQCADDFHSGRMWTHFDTSTCKIKDIGHLSINIIYWLVASGKYRMRVNEPSKLLTTPLKELAKLNDIKTKISLFRPMKLQPKKLSPKLSEDLNMCDPLIRYLMYRKLKGDLENFYSTWGDVTLGKMRQQFVDDMLYSDVPSYGLEFFKAKQVKMTDDRAEKEGEVDAIIRPYPDGCAPGLFFNKRIVCPLIEIISIRVDEAETSQSDEKFCIHIIRKRGSFVVLEFKTAADARSFVSVLKSYCRMQINFYNNVVDSWDPAPSVAVLKALRSFGPTKGEDAAKLLADSQSQRPVQREGGDASRELTYAIYQDWQKFYLFHVWASGEGNGGGRLVCDILWTPHDQESGAATFTVQFGGGMAEQHFRDSHALRRMLNEKYGRPCIPRDEQCAAMDCLVEDDQLLPYSYYLPGHSETTRSYDNGTQPCLFKESDMPATSDQNCIAKREFADIFVVEDKKHDRDVIIKKITNTRLEVTQAYTRGIAHLHSLRECSYAFLRFYGQMMVSPLRFVLEMMPAGSLLDRMKTKEPRLNWLQMCSVLHELGLCLYDLGLKKMTYGSFCCSKILIQKERLDSMHIKLGDPGRAFYLDTLPVSDTLNQSRLPWVAVERFHNLSAHTMASEMYAVGTVIWEILWSGTDPITQIPFSSVQAFFTDGNMLSEPFPPQEKVRTWMGVSHYCTASPSLAADASSLHSASTSGATHSAFTSGATHSASTSGATHSASTSGATNASVETASTTISETRGDASQQASASAGESTGEPNAASGESRPTASKERIMSLLVDLMKKCWNREPNDRPSPGEFIKEVRNVLDVATELKMSDPEWHAQLLLDQARQMDFITNESAAQRLQQFLIDRQNQGDASPDQREQLKRLMTESFPKFILNNQLRLPENSQVLGQGEYGKVLQGTLLPPPSSRQEEEEQDRNGSAEGMVVAVKTMRATGDRQEKQLFINEAMMWSKLTYPTPHPNIVTLHGIILPSLREQSSSIQLVMESADLGSLDRYVKTSRNKLGTLTFKLRLRKLAQDIANGMDFLSQQKLTHGDLAARNILLFSNGPDVQDPTAKISDFGLAHWLKGGVSDPYYRLRPGIRMPVYWMALEVLEESQFISKSDVWSFGTVLWEMMSANDPVNFIMPAVRDNEVMKELLAKYRRGDRLPKPQYCPQAVYRIMMECWQQDPSARPNFDELVSRLTQLTEQDLDRS